MCQIISYISNKYTFYTEKRSGRLILRHVHVAILRLKHLLYACLYRNADNRMLSRFRCTRLCLVFHRKILQENIRSIRKQLLIRCRHELARLPYCTPLSVKWQQRQGRQTILSRIIYGMSE